MDVEIALSLVDGVVVVESDIRDLEWIVRGRESSQKFEKSSTKNFTAKKISLGCKELTY